MAREQQAAEAKDVAQLRGVGEVGVARVRFELRDAGLDIVDECAGDRIRRRQRAVGHGRHGDVAKANAEERALQLLLDLDRVDVELVRPDARQPDVEDEIGIGHR